MSCVSVGSLVIVMNKSTIYRLEPWLFRTIRSPMHPGNPGTNTCLENEKPPKTPIEIRDFSGKRPLFFPWSFMLRPTKSSHNHPHPFSGAEPWLTTHGSFGKGLTVTRPENIISCKHPKSRCLSF